ncbi:Exocyst complex component 2 [Schistosoma japonicum]|uniref:Exocyst complex component 2 n=2 Tax=Schistosoma japonicum TaxID=6182 RepID=A0A4Z2CP64_SCHJA|nr:Exocyst complex component 2 [Schistosoma japonicum]
MGKPSGPAPQVNGISPNEGTPGTKLTIRGENLGNTASDLLHVFIGGIDVGRSAQWFSPKKITAITPLGEGELEIVVVTDSGGFGTAAVIYQQNILRVVSPQTVVTYWPEDDRRIAPTSVNNTGVSSGSTIAVGCVPGAELDHSTGLPISELSRISMPLSESALREIYPRSGSVHLADKDFNPVMFLLKFYKNSNFNDLLITVRNFRHSMGQEGPSEPVNVIRTNLVLIFRCLDGMDYLRHKLESEKKSIETRSSHDSRLESILYDARTLGYRLFEDILQRRNRGDSIKNAISVMQRYQFLFNLPHAIRTNISKGDYNLVLNDYLRAKSLFSTSDTEVLRRIYSDVETVVANFSVMLRNQLISMPIDCDEARHKIGYLTQLEVDYDPGWLCLTYFKDWLIDQLRNYQRLSHQSMIDGNSIKTKESNSSNIIGNLLTIDNKSSLMNPDSSILFADEFYGVPSIVGMAKAICRLLTTHVTQFWRLGAAYISGQLNYTNQKSYDKLGQASTNDLKASWVPLLYEDIIADSLILCEDQVFPRTFIEKPLFDSAEIQERFPEWSGIGMISFIAVSQRLADQIEHTVHRPRDQEESGDCQSNWLDPSALNARHSGQSIISQARGLLLILNNIEWVACRANYRLLNLYRSLGYVSADRLQATLDGAWEEGRKDICSRYVKLRGEWLCSPLQSYLSNLLPSARYSGIKKKFDIYLINGLQSSLQEVLANLSHIYSELILLIGLKSIQSSLPFQNNSVTGTNGAQPVCSINIQGIFLQIIEYVIQNIHDRLIEHDISNWSKLAQLQLTLDMNTIKLIVPNQLFTNESNKLLYEICSRFKIKISPEFSQLGNEESKHLSKLLEREKMKMRVLINGLSALQSKPRVSMVEE